MATIIKIVDANGTGGFEVGVYTNSKVFVVAVPIGVDFDATAYAPANPWDEPLHRLYFKPVDGSEIIDVSVDADYSLNEQDGEWWSNIGRNVNRTYTVIASGGGVTVVAPYNKLFAVNSPIIDQFSNLSIWSGGEAIKDLSEYVIALLNIPFKLPDEIQTTPANIVLGEINTQIEAPIITVDKIVVDLGSIDIGTLSGSSLDYVANSYELIFPFIDNVLEISPEMIVDKTISVNYVIDAYSGDITVNVYNGGSEPFNSFSASIGRNIPFNTLNEVNSAIGRKQGVDNETLKAYVRVSKQVLEQSDYSNLIHKVGNLLNFSGYVEVSKIELQSKALLQERQELINILSEGVVI